MAREKLEEFLISKNENMPTNYKDRTLNSAKNTKSCCKGLSLLTSQEYIFLSLKSTAHFFFQVFLKTLCFYKTWALFIDC